jgi:hypothetical protein
VVVFKESDKEIAFSIDFWTQKKGDMQNIESLTFIYLFPCYFAYCFDLCFILSSTCLLRYFLFFYFIYFCFFVCFFFVVEKLPLNKKKWTTDSLDGQWSEKVFFFFCFVGFVIVFVYGTNKQTNKQANKQTNKTIKNRTEEMNKTNE